MVPFCPLWVLGSFIQSVTQAERGHTYFYMVTGVLVYLDYIEALLELPFSLVVTTRVWGPNLRYQANLLSPPNPRTQTPNRKP